MSNTYALCLGKYPKRNFGSSSQRLYLSMTTTLIAIRLGNKVKE